MLQGNAVLVVAFAVMSCAAAHMPVFPNQWHLSTAVFTLILSCFVGRTGGWATTSCATLSAPKPSPLCSTVHQAAKVGLSCGLWLDKSVQLITWRQSAMRALHWRLPQRLPCAVGMHGGHAPPAPHSAPHAGTPGPKAWEQLELLQASRPFPFLCVLPCWLLECTCCRRSLTQYGLHMHQ